MPNSLEFLNLNTVRNYPIREGLSKLDTTGQFTLPDVLFVDFQLAATNDATRRFFVSKFTNKLTSAVVEVSTTDTQTVVGSFELDLAGHELYDDYTMNSSGAFIGAVGKLTVGEMSVLTQLPAGVFYFDTTASEFEPRTILVAPLGVTRLSFTNTTGATYTLTGDVQLVAKSNLRFFHEPDTNRIVLDAITANYSEKCIEYPCVKMINGVRPDPQDGNISALGLDCTNVSSPAPYTIAVKDTCCKPCSGCDELADLTNKLTTLEVKYLELRDFQTALSQQLSVYISVANSNCSCPTS